MVNYISSSNDRWSLDYLFRLSELPSRTRRIATRLFRHFPESKSSFWTHKGLTNYARVIPTLTRVELKGRPIKTLRNEVPQGIVLGTAELRELPSQFRGVSLAEARCQYNTPLPQSPFNGIEMQI